MRNESGLMRDEKGQILIWVVALMMLAALIIPPFLASAYAGVHTSKVRQEKMQELYAADTGIEDALRWIISDGDIQKPKLDDPNGNSTFPPGNSSTAEYAEYRLSDWSDATQLWIPRLVNNCWVDIRVERDVSLYPLGNYTYFVYSNATNQDTGTHVKVQVHVTQGNITLEGSWITPPPIIKPSGCVSNNPFSYAIGSLAYGSGVDIKQGNVTGDVFVNGPVNLLGGNNYIYGNVYSVGDLVLNEGSWIKGNASTTGNLTLNQGSIIWENAWGNKSITLRGSEGIKGDAYAQANITVNSGSVQSSAYADNDVNVFGVINQSAYANHDINGTGTIEGVAHYLNYLQPTVHVGSAEKLIQAVDVPQPIMPAIGPPPQNPDAAYYGNATGPGHTTLTGDQKIQGKDPVFLGPCLINGNLEVKDTLVLTGTVYVTGTITLDNNCVVTTGTSTPSTPAVLVAVGDVTIYGNVNAQVDQAMPLIMSVNGDIKCWNNSVVNGALYAPNGIVWVHNGAKVYGAIVAQQITSIKDTGSNATKKSYIVYDPAVQNIPGLPYAEIPVTGPPEVVQPPDEQGPPILIPTGVNIDSYIVLER